MVQIREVTPLKSPRDSPAADEAPESGQHMEEEDFELAEEVLLAPGGSSIAL